MATQPVNVFSVYTFLLFLFWMAFPFAPKLTEFGRLSPVMLSAWLPLGCGFALVSNN
jgi:hypothetical protein